MDDKEVLVQGTLLDIAASPMPEGNDRTPNGNLPGQVGNLGLQPGIKCLKVENHSWV